MYLALLYLENLRRLRANPFSQSMLGGNSASVFPAMDGCYQPVQTISNSLAEQVHTEPKFNFHKLAESATKDKISKRKTRPKKEYICR